jgi:hypothetical protein
MDVLAANGMALALNPMCGIGSNMVRSVLLDPEVQALHPNFEKTAADTVASLRASVGADLDDPQLIELVGELSLKSDLFRRLWARHEVRTKTHGTKQMHHPMVGDLELHYESLSVNGNDGQLLCRRWSAGLKPRGLDLRTELLGQRHQARRRPDHHGEVGHQAVGADPQQVDALEVAVAHAGAEDEPVDRVVAAAGQLVRVAEVLEGLEHEAQQRRDGVLALVGLEDRRAVEGDVVVQGRQGGLDVARLDAGAEMLSGAHRRRPQAACGAWRSMMAETSVPGGSVP